jgi:hypothetical protein
VTAADSQERKGLQMRSTTGTYLLRGSPRLVLTGAICAGILFPGIALTATSAAALVAQAGSSLQHQLKQDSRFWDLCPQ